MEEVSRSKLQKNAFICIFQYLFYNSYLKKNKKVIDEIVIDVMNVNFDECDPFFKAVVFETIKDKDSLIEIIQENLKSTWKFNRLNLVDQAILLIFSSEILHNLNEKQVCINEAVEFAKKYSDDKSYKYINAVLDKISKNYEH